MTHYHIFSEKKTLFNRYLIKKILSKGNFGNTYLVEDLKQNNQQFVLKEFLQNKKDIELNPQIFRLVKENAKLLDKLNHKQIPQFLHWLEQNNNLFLVQQYIEGYTYDQLLAKKKENNDLFSEEEVINFLKSLLLVIDYIHRKNIIHKNISPDNIIFSNQIQKPV